MAGEMIVLNKELVRAALAAQLCIEKKLLAIAVDAYPNDFVKVKQCEENIKKLDRLVNHVLNDDDSTHVKLIMGDLKKFYEEGSSITISTSPTRAIMRALIRERDLDENIEYALFCALQWVGGTESIFGMRRETIYFWIQKLGNRYASRRRYDLSDEINSILTWISRFWRNEMYLLGVE